jgi:hypothetical protein
VWQSQCEYETSHTQTKINWYTFNSSEEIFTRSADYVRQTEEVIHNLKRPGITVEDQNCQGLCGAGIGSFINQKREGLARKLLLQLIGKGNTKHLLAEGACLGEQNNFWILTL